MIYPWRTEIRNGVALPYQENGEVRVEVKGDSLMATVTTTRTSEFSPTRLEAQRSGGTDRGADSLPFSMSAAIRQRPPPSLRSASTNFPPGPTVSG